MTTIPPRPAEPPNTKAHEQRDIAESFGVDAARYDRARSRYPDELIRRIVDTAPGREILDVGCGTGIEARQLIAAGRTVLGVEPDERMAAFARDSGVTVENGEFEEWDPDGRRFDAVVAGTAWHWVDPMAGIAQAARVLRPGGPLVVFWNAGDPPSEVTAALAAGMKQVLPDSPLPYSARRVADVYEAGCAKVAGEIAEAGGFAPARQWRFTWDDTYTRAAWLEQLSTTGGFTQAPPGALDAVLEAVGDAIDALGGSMTVRFTTLAVAAVRDDT
jgi:SAM-dependent methyltransferase